MGSRLVRGIALALLVPGCGRIGFSVENDAGGMGSDVADGEVSSAYAGFVLGDGPVAYWRFGLSQPASVVVDVTGHGHDGTANTGVMLAAPGLIANDPNPAAWFDGVTGAIQVQDDPALHLPGPLTVEAWVQATSFAHGTGAQFPRIVHSANGNNTGYALVVAQQGTTDSGRLRCEFDTLAGSPAIGTTVLVPGRTYHLACTYDGATSVAYVDGVVDATSARTGTIVSTVAPLGIGARGDATRIWSGTLDEVALYDRALMASEIADHHAAGR